MRGPRSIDDRIKDAVGDMIVLAAVLDPCGKVIAVDPLALEQAGLSQDKVLGVHFADCYWFNFSTPGADALRQDLFRARLGYLARRETIMRVRPSERQPVLLQCKPYRDAQGSIDEIVVIALGLGGDKGGAELVRSEITRLTTINRELVHRVKNIFAVILAALSISYRQTATREALLEMAQARIAALSKAHLLAVDVTQRQPADAVALETLIRTVISPHLSRPEMARIAGANAEIPLKYLTPLTLILHELATNSVKYGSLSREDGGLEISWKERETGQPSGGEGCSISLFAWSETCACDPMIAKSDGFGSRLLQRCANQMKGRIEVSQGANAYEFRLFFD